jgi:hypothetical protein
VGSKKPIEQTSPGKYGGGKTERTSKRVKNTTPAGGSQSPIPTDPWAYYRSKGFSVFPVRQDKKPAVKWKEFQERYATDEEIVRWKKAGFGIGIACGILSNLSVVDLDSDEALTELEALNPDGIKIPTVVTPTGGTHFYFKYNSSFPRNDTKRGKCKKIDIRSEGGFVVTAPTRAKYEKPKGNPIEGNYEWNKDFNLETLEIPEPPKRWIYRLHHLAKIGRIVEEDGEKLSEGRRDNDIFYMACVWRREGYSRELAEKLALAMAKECDPPFTRREALEKVESAWKRPVRDKYKRTVDDGSIPIIVKASEVEAREVAWLWRNHIALDRLTLLSGDPGVGKSWFTLDLCCRLSRGGAWGDGTPGGEPANSFYMTIEDNMHDTIKPRITQLGGDDARIGLYNSEHPIYLNLSEGDGLERVEEAIVEFGNVRLFVIDPILDFTGATNPNAVEMVRALLNPLHKMAERLHIAIVIIGHLTKAQMASAMYKAAGSGGGWMGKVRTAFAIGYNRETDEKKRFFIPLKNNIAFPFPSQLSFEITDTGLDIQLCDVDIEEVLNPQIGRPKVRRTAAVDFIDSIFQGRDEVPSAEIDEKCRVAEIKDRTRDRAKIAGGYQSIRKPDGTWVWKKRRSGDVVQTEN